MKKIVLLMVIFSWGIFAENNSSLWKVEDIKGEYKIGYDRNRTCLIRHIKLYKNQNGSQR